MTSRNKLRQSKRTTGALISCLLPALCAGTAAHAAEARIALSSAAGSIPGSARALGAVASTDTVRLAISLPLRNQSQLSDLLTGLYDPKDARYHQFLTPAQFADQFGPTQADYNAVIAYAKAQGLQVTGTYSNRTLVDVSGPASDVETAFGVRLAKYQQPDGSTFHAPDRAPSLPTSVGVIVSNVIGLNDSVRPRSLAHPVAPAVAINSYANPVTQGTGPGGGFSPTDTRVAYNLTGVATPGQNQVLGLMELDGYLLSDITKYETYFNLPRLTPTNVLVDGFDGSAGGGAGEVTLDIDCMLALAPNASKIIVYEAGNTFQGLLDCYAKIASDNQATSISSSWGTSEIYGDGIRDQENATFQQMAAQGQSFFIAAGDAGAYDDGISLSVGDTAAQPYATSVGGTNLFVNGAGGAYYSETSWADPQDTGRTDFGTGGGGGISTIWPIPSWQKGVANSSNKGSTTMRNVPDVSLFGDYDTGGYSIVLGGGWAVYNGTSAAAPLWAGFAAVVNQQRGVGSGGSPIGFMNPTIYSLAESSRYSADFHDVNDGSNNLYWPAVTGYDLSTGWGSLNGANLLSDLAGGPVVSLTQATTRKVILSWLPINGATGYNVYRGTASGAENQLIATVGGATTLTDMGIVDGTTFYYIVTPIVAGKEGKKSVEISALPLDPPAQLQSALGGTGVQLTWSAVKSAAGYQIYRGTTATSMTAIGQASIGTTYTDTAVKAGTTYYYAVTALGPQAHEESAWSPTTSFTVHGPDAPTGLVASPLSNAVALSWTASQGASLYNVKRATSASGPFSILARPSSTRFTDTDAVNGTTYYYQVSAVNVIGEGSNTATATATPSVQYSAPPTPTGLSGTPAAGSITLKWNAAARAASYTVKRSTKSSGVYTNIATVPAPTLPSTTPTYTDKTTVAGTVYYYEVTATNSYGTSPATAYIGVVAK